MGGAEAESHLRQLDLEALHRASQREFSSSDASDAIGTDSAAPTYYQKKLYTSLSETERWQFADDCAEILMKRVWEKPHEQFDAMKRACDDFLIQHKLILTVSSLSQ